MSDIQFEIRYVSGCTRREAKIIHDVMLNEQVNIGGLKFSEFKTIAKRLHLLLSLYYSKN